MTIDECQALVDKILASRYVARRYDDTMRHITMRGGIHVRPGRNGGHATVDYAPGGYFGAVIGLGLWARQPVVVIHEVAHHLTGLWHQHDHHFAATMLDLTRHFMGADPAATLAASYKEHGVRTRPKATRTMTPQQRDSPPTAAPLAPPSPRSWPATSTTATNVSPATVCATSSGSPPARSQVSARNGAGNAATPSAGRPSMGWHRDPDPHLRRPADVPSTHSQ
jgi:putative metallohydrolase (TIGR04338 family)